MNEPTITPPDPATLADMIDLALREDGAGRDITSELVVPEGSTGTYALVAREPGVFSGAVVLQAFAARYHDDGLRLEMTVHDGAKLLRGRHLATLSGPTRTILLIERPLLNFLQRLCGIATTTSRFVEAVAGTRARILDTRKTVPGWRDLDKYAVRCGGGMNHRMGLHDAVLVKDNHLVGVPITNLRDHLDALVARAKAQAPLPAFVEVEVDTLEQLAETLRVPGLDRILLDNFSNEELRRAVAMRDEAVHAGNARIDLEASGGVTIETVGDIARTGVDFISVGALTHSVRCLDLALDER